MYKMDQSKANFKGDEIKNINQISLDSSVTYLEGNAQLLTDLVKKLTKE